MGSRRKKSIDLLVLLLCVHENYANDNLTSGDGFHQNSIIVENADNRLPDSVIPVTYEIMVTPDPDKEPFSLQGTVKIQMKVSEKSDKIVLHVGTLNVNSVTVNDSDDITSHTLQSFTSVKIGILMIPLVNPIFKNTVIIIAIQEQGILMHRMIGFYKSSYYAKEKKHKLIGIQHDHPYEDTQRSESSSRHVEIVKNRSRNIDAASIELSQNSAESVATAIEAINLMDISGTAIATDNAGVSNHAATIAVVTTDATAANATTETNVADVLNVFDAVDPVYIALAVLLVIVIIIVGTIACLWMFRKLTMDKAGSGACQNVKVSCFTGICVYTKN